MSDYNFEIWLQSQSGLDFETLKTTTLDAVIDAELRAKDLRPPVEGVSKEQLEEFVVRGKTLYTLLNSRERDYRTTEEDWLLFKSLCQTLVSKNQIDASIMNLFPN